MSRKCCNKELLNVPMFRGVDNKCICNFPTLVILILIVLQFSKNKGEKGSYGGNHGKNEIGNGVLFIIALFFLTCAGCGKGAY
ncbi:hypothetical protein N3C_0639 [Clostridium sp. N3C]|uniref:hypothetical protein n=1 Tax=Clostridium sp. N3C TaxID=1776758 RepID=UPI00092E15E3|nr:hypothetical protein [Clostridium sp. N3C]SCN22200.1 hypothetical protein N3C_0639 [Clostridium sp. N3C]